MKRVLTLLPLIAFAAGDVFGVTTETNDWENLAVSSINRLPARSYSAPLASERAALTGDLEPETPYVKSLNGIWKFAWTGDPVAREMDFWEVAYDDTRWFEMAVPSCVELNGFGVPIYANSG